MRGPARLEARRRRRGRQLWRRERRRRARGSGSGGPSKGRRGEVLDSVAQGLVPQVAVVLEGLKDFGQEGGEMGLFVLVRGNHWAGCADRIGLWDQGSAGSERGQERWSRAGGYARSCCSRKRDSRSRNSWRSDCGLHSQPPPFLRK